MSSKKRKPIGKRKSSVYVEEGAIGAQEVAPNITSVAMKVPTIVTSFDTSMIKQAQEKPDWSLYRIEIRDNVPFIVRELCDRCGKVKIPKPWLKLRRYNDKELGDIYLETGICKDCINASKYVDKYLDGEVLTEKEAKQQFYLYAGEYERAWRLVLASAPREAITHQEWLHRCEFFGGCAICGADIEVQAKYFPTFLNGAHTSWNVIPMCNECLKQHYAGRVNISKKVSRYKVFSTRAQFQRTKTIRMYLLAQMEKHSLYMDPLMEYRSRFFETRILEGAD